MVAAAWLLNIPGLVIWLTPMTNSSAMPDECFMQLRQRGAPMHDNVSMNVAFLVVLALEDVVGQHAELHLGVGFP